MWIEIAFTSSLCGRYTMSPPIRRCGLKFPIRFTIIRVVACHLPYGGVDWNLALESISFRAWSCHLLYGGVDWNSIDDYYVADNDSHLLYGGVDWNLYCGQPVGNRQLGHLPITFTNVSFIDFTRPLWVSDISILSTDSPLDFKWWIANNIATPKAN